jgi:hypothetical protein
MEVVTVFKIESHANGKISEDTAAIYQELALLRAENKHLRGRLAGNQRGSQTVRAAIVDAHQLIMNAFSDKSTGRLTMSRLGMGKRRWAWAVAFLRYAGIVSTNNRRWRQGLEFIVKELAQCITLLETGGKELMERPDGYKVLNSYLRDV